MAPCVWGFEVAMSIGLVCANGMEPFARTARSGVRGVRIKQGRAVTRRGQKGRLVSRAAAGRKRQEVLQRCWFVMARILL